MIHKSISYRRHVANTHKIRRIHIAINCMDWKSITTNTRAQGQLRKGKVHCSCPRCSNKSTKANNITSNMYAIKNKQMKLAIQNEKEQLAEFYSEAC